MKTIRALAIGALSMASFLVPTYAGINVAGTNQVNFDATGFAAGSLVYSVTNTGAIGGNFIAFGQFVNATNITTNDLPIATAAGGGSIGLVFDGRNYYQLFDNSGTNMLPTPASMTGTNPTVSIEAWVFANALDFDGQIVSWGRNGGTNALVAFEAGFGGGGAMNRNGATPPGPGLNAGFGVNGPSVAWGGTIPSVGTWHYLAYTFDGPNRVNRLYIDGNLVGTTTNFQDVNVWGLTNVAIAASHNSGGAINGSNDGSRARMVIGKVRVDDGLLAPSDIANNYSFEAPSFTKSMSSLVSAPIHRWSFSGIPASTDLGDNVVTVADTGSSPAGNATMREGTPGKISSDGSRVILAGGYATASGSPGYIQLPDHLISSLSLSNSGPGKVTFEGWATWQANNTWSSMFSFGSVSTNTNYTTGKVTLPFNTTLPGYGGGSYVNWGETVQNIRLMRWEIDPNAGANPPANQTNRITVTVTNPPIDGDTITINATTLTWKTTVTTPATQIQIDPNISIDATNLATQVSNNPIAGIFLDMPATNAVRFKEVAVLPVITTTTNWSTISGNSAQRGADTLHDFAESQFPGPYGMKHWAMTWDEASGVMDCYVNGVKVAHTVVNMQFWNVNDVNDWLGRDNWSGDGYMGGTYTEFREYNRVLSDAEIQNEYIFGPGFVRTAGAEGALSSIAIQPLKYTNTFIGGGEQITVLANYANVSNVNITTAPGITYNSSAPSVTSVGPDGQLAFLTAGSSTISAVFGGLTNSMTITNKAIGATLAHHYSFAVPDLSTTTVTDLVDGVSLATVNNGFIVNSNAALDSSALGYVILPTNSLTGQDSITLEAWLDTPSTNGNNTYAWSFGNTDPATGGNNVGIYGLFYAARSGANSRSAIFDCNRGFDGEQNATAVNQNLNGRGQMHVVGIYSPQIGLNQVWVNGVEQNQAENYSPISDVSNVENWLGRSLYPADPYLTGNIADFRIYNGALTAQQIALDFSTGPRVIVSNPGALNSVSLGEQFPTLPIGVSETLNFLGQFANATNINLFSYGIGSYTLSNSNPTIASFNPQTQQLTALTNGSTTLVATYGGKSATNLITVFVSSPVLQHEYAFSGTDSVATDSVAGATFNGTINGGAVQGGGQVTLDGTSGYVSLPTNIFSGYFSASLECWATFGTNTPGCMLWGFGTQDLANIAANYLYMSPNITTTGAKRTGVTAADPGNTGEQNASSPGILDNKTNVYIAAVYSPFRGFIQLFINGQVAATNTLNILLTNVQDNLSFLGRSLYDNATNPYPASVYLNGSIDDFRISTGELTGKQIAVNVGTGPNVKLDASLVTTLNSITVTPANPSVPLGSTVQLGVLGTFANVTNVNMVGFNGPGGAVFSSADTTVATVDTNGLVTGNGLGTSVITVTVASPAAKTNTVTVTVTRGPFIALRHRYTFTTDARDVVNHALTTNWDGTLEAGAFISNNAVQFNGIAGTGSYVALPVGLVSSQTNLTIEAWASTPDPSTGREWQRIFDIGNCTGVNTTDTNATNLFLTNGNGVYNYATNGWMTNGAGVAGIFLTSTANTGSAGGVPTGNFARFAYSTNDNNGQATEVPTMNSTTAMVTNQNTHFVVVFDAIHNVWQLWQNGVLMPAGTAVATDATTPNGVAPNGPTFGTNGPTSAPNGPLGGLIDLNSWLGRSAWGGDPYWLGSMSDVRIWEGVLTGPEIQQFHNAGPQNAVFPVLKLTQVGANVVASWPSWAGRYLLQGNPSPSNPAGWTNFPLASIVDVTTNRQVTVPITGSPLYLRLSN